MKLFNLIKISNFEPVRIFLNSKISVWKAPNDTFLIQKIKYRKKGFPLLLSHITLNRNEAIQFVGTVMKELYAQDSKSDDEIIEAFTHDLASIVEK